MRTTIHDGRYAGHAGAAHRRDAAHARPPTPAGVVLDGKTVVPDGGMA
ncbi:MAG TPA: hypothetical protein VFL99_07240 [Segeticoccus sp.]|nr:hypothetical protein [Segeticoccus sp.]HET8600103.1 hypothetical protein [Segeticoccus sp.]